MKPILWLSVAATVGLAAAGWALFCKPPTGAAAEHIVDVYPGDDIQRALDQAAEWPGSRVVRVHAGTYRPTEPGQALIHFNARHDGIRLLAVGAVTLTAANPDIADPKAPGHPAVVAHVVYFGDGISNQTVLRGFRITGANGFVRGPADLQPIRSAEDLVRSVRYVSREAVAIEPGDFGPKTHYFFTDGGAILVYGRSFPTIEDVEIEGNSSTVCGAGLSVQHHLTEGFRQAVRCRHCIFRNNRTAVSGPAADLLSAGSYAVFENCLFVGNQANEKIDANGRSGYGALTVFRGCRVEVRHCTFTNNSAGVDDRSTGSAYEDTIFWNDRRVGGVNHRPRFELDVTDAHGVRGCFIHGVVNDLRGNVNAVSNTLDPPDPDFDAEYRPRQPLYASVGYRPPPPSAAEQ